jgi:hypothetical protein
LLEGGVKIDFYELVQKYREFLAEQWFDKDRGKHGAFAATLSSYDKDGNNRNSPCLCGEDHRFSACPYLIEQVRPVGWQPNAQLQKNIDQKLQESETLRTAVEKARKWAEQHLEPSSF